MSDLLTLHFHKTGIQTTIQDQGRRGHQSFGVPVGGVMDKSSARIANWLVGNDERTPVLEITIMGPVIEFSDVCQIALAGANLSPSINGEAISMYESIEVPAGARLSFGRVETGCRTYLAVNGQWKLNKWLNSCSTLRFSNKIFPKGSYLRNGDSLVIRKKQLMVQRVFPEPLQLQKESLRKIRVLPGPEFDQFSNLNIGYFFSRIHKITADSNRMGYRLEPRIDNFKPSSEMISSGVFPGVIQITNSGQPIILMADAQTTGGYPRIGIVIAADLDLIAQCKPGEEIELILVTNQEAQNSLKEKETQLNNILGNTSV